MTTRARRQGERTGYAFRFAGTALLLVAGTLVLVLYVLPERYVLSAGFREGNFMLPSPSTPFALTDPLRVAALPELPLLAPTPETVIVRGPADVFWERVTPLLEARRYDEAIPIFEERLRVVDDPELRLLLARMLRDDGRVRAASVHYAELFSLAPGDEALALEWARALAWIEDYEWAERVLLLASRYRPGSVALRVEMARIHYYSDRLRDAERTLATLTDAELAEAGAVALRSDVRSALTPPAEIVVTAPPPTLLEQAIAAREDDDFERAATLFEAALVDEPGNVEAWRAYADFLEYELGDLTGALDALEEAERRAAATDAALQYRMALLEIWTERTAEARLRLGSLLALLEGEGAESAEAGPAADEPAAGGGLPDPVTPADALALIGDLDRWSGDRLAAARRYEEALVDDPEHARSLEGLSALRAEVHRVLVEAEEPGLGAVASSFADTDDFRRFDAGGDWTGLHGDWVWATRSGARWVEGLDPLGAGATREGLFAELEGGRWWRWGTVRTGVHLGVQNVRSNTVDLSAGASVRRLGLSGARTDVRFDHEPAYGLTNTLQALAADVRQDRLTVAHAHPLSERWSASVSGDVASLDHRGITGSDRNLRLQAGASVGRSVGGHVTVGLAARALRYAGAAPDATSVQAPDAASAAVSDAGAVALYWDPNASVSVGPYARLAQPLGRWWELTTRLNPGLAYIDERRRVGGEIVPDLSASLGLLRDGVKYVTLVELFYGQGRFTGYRSFGANVSFTWRAP